MTVGFATGGSAVSTLMVCTPLAAMSNSMRCGAAAVALRSALAAAIAARSVPAPESAVEVTRKTVPADASGAMATHDATSTSMAPTARAHDRHPGLARRECATSVRRGPDICRERRRFIHAYRHRRPDP